MTLADMLILRHLLALHGLADDQDHAPVGELVVKHQHLLCVSSDLVAGGETAAPPKAIMLVWWSGTMARMN